MSLNEKVLVATQSEMLMVDPERGTASIGSGFGGQRPTAVAADLRVAGGAWCSTSRGGVFRSDDGGLTRSACGLGGEKLMTVAASPAQNRVKLAGISIHQLAAPPTLQQHALDLLGVTVAGTPVSIKPAPAA